MKHFIEINDFSKEEILKCIDDAIRLKKKSSHLSSIASGKVLAMIFEKKSTRTRLSFDVAIRQLGGSSIVLDIGDIHLGAGNESLSDTSKTIALYVDALVVRVNNHKNIVEFLVLYARPTAGGHHRRWHQRSPSSHDHRAAANANGVQRPDRAVARLLIIVVFRPQPLVKA